MDLLQKLDDGIITPNSYFVNRLLGNYFRQQSGDLSELTIDNEQLTIMVSLRDEFEYF